MPALPTEKTSVRTLRWIVTLLVAGAGVFFLIGGSMLLQRGGSAYFVLMGAALSASAFGLLKRQAWGAPLYGLALLLTIAWSISDAGWEFWPLFSRIYVFSVLGVFVGLLYRSVHHGRIPGRLQRTTWAGVMVILLVGNSAATAAMFLAHGAVKVKTPARVNVPATVGPVEWEHPGADPGGRRYSAATQIHSGNVHQLELAWVARTGDIHESDGSGAEDQNTPLQIGDDLYVCTAYGKVLALDPDTGEERWTFDPEAKALSWQRCRGLGYHGGATAATAGATSDGRSQQCTRQLFVPTVDARLIAIDAETGRKCEDFGEAGTVDLRTGLGQLEDGWYRQTSPPLVAGNLVVVGGRAADTTDRVPGVVRAFDVYDGSLVWAWDPGAPDSIAQSPSEERPYTKNSPNVWAALSHDPDLGLIYLGTGNATPTYWGGNRTEQTDAMSSSVVALDAVTGQMKWRFQTIYHDLWNFDIPAQPVLVDIPDASGDMLRALLQVTKQGEIFMLNRATGEPISPVEDRPVPVGNIPGERYSPVQPYSVGMPSIGNETLTESDMWGATAFDLLVCRILFRGMDYQGLYTPPGLRPILQYPGSLGGMNWGGASVDPARRYMFVNDMRLGLYKRLVPREALEPDDSARELGFPYGSDTNRFLSPVGIPCHKPPFGTMTAIDLQTRSIAWQVPVGTVEHTGPLDIPMRLPIPIGMPTLGPSLATAGGLLFFAGSQDFYLRAWDSATGEEIWKAELPVGSQGGPISYVSSKSGRQYIVITAGGARLSQQRGDYVLAYALDESG